MVDQRATFISSLVPAYTLIDAFGQRVPVKAAEVKPLSMRSWWTDFSRFEQAALLDDEAFDGLDGEG